MPWSGQKLGIFPIRVAHVLLVLCACLPSLSDVWSPTEPGYSGFSSNPVTWVGSGWVTNALWESRQTIPICFLAAYFSYTKPSLSANGMHARFC